MAERRGLTGFHDLHSGAAIVVCGCGASLNDLVQPERFVTIGVNDIGRKFHPNYLVVLNPREQFTGDRFRYVESSQAQYIFTQLDLSLSHPGVVRFRLGQYGGTDLSDPEVLPYTQNSPYVALCLAAQMGARRIGLIGVDFTEHHFFAATGTHQLSPQLATIDEQYRRLGAALRARGIEVYNLSQQSLLTAFPKMTLEEFAMNTAPAVSQTAPRVFGVDYRFLACGEVFGTGLRHAAADLGLAYDGALWDDPALPQKIDRFQPDLILVVHGRRFAQTWGETFRRYHTAVWLTDEPYEVDDTATWSGLFQTVFVNDPNTRARHRNAHYLPVCFDPHVQRDLALPRDYGAGFIGGYNNVREEYLKGLAEAGLLAYVVGGPWRSAALQRLSLGDNVAPARTAELYQQTRIVLNVFRAVHHFNRERVAARSLNPRIYEALACGALVVSEERAELAEVFPELPTFHDPQRLTDLIERLLADEPHRLSLLEQSRARLVGHSYADRLARVLQVCLGYDSARAVVAPHQMLPPDAAATRAPVALPFANPQSVNANPPAKVSVIIPHGGQERAPQLIATLANLHRCHGVAEIIVVEMGVAPTAENIVRQGGDKYVFVHHEGAFERARALNIGTPFATSDLLLWMDNDLLLPVEFLLHAVQELHERRLDFLVPWTAVHYLSEADTAQVLQGLRQPAACAPSNTFYSQRGTSGGAGLVRKSFVLQYGGLSEGFRGWGGEDDAWFYKAHLLGAAAATERQDQILFHLFHTDSADPVRNRIARNPHYADNLALLTAMRSIRQREIFLQRFPPPATFSCPWPVSCRIALVGHSEDVTVGGKAEQVGQMLKALYGTVLERFVVEENGSFPELIQAGARQLPEAILVFGSAVARQLLANACLEPVWKQIIVIHDSDVPSDSASLDIMARAGAHLATAKASGDLLQQAGLQPWPHAVCDDDHDAARHLALGLAQPLSVLLGRAAAGPMFETTKGDAMKAPEYSILMVTHNGLEMIRMSTLRTLRHIAGQDARLIVVDNASTDGSLEWLEMLARRGDIELIRNATNIGHGPALELAWHKTRSPYIVTLDSDAFPLSDDWLPRLRARLEGNVKVAGIRHHRDYVHPSCLMIARQTLEEFNLSFLERAHQPLRHDVGEAISYEIKQRGYEIAGLELSDCQRRGSTAEPIYLGSEYEGIVYHQWYTTRALRSAGKPVDDVPPEALERSLREVIESFQAQAREVTVVLSVHSLSDQPEHSRQSLASLQALNLQSLPRWRFRLIVVEQGHRAHLEAVLKPLADHYLFLYNPGRYNRAQAYARGAGWVGLTEAFCLLDADFLGPPDFLRRGLAELRRGRSAVVPFSDVLLLDAASTERAIEDCLTAPLPRLDERLYRGAVLHDRQDLHDICLWVKPDFYSEVLRATEKSRRDSLASLARLPGRMLHLGRQDATSQLPPASRPPARDWQHWHRWSARTIEDVVRAEDPANSSRHIRRRLAEIVVKLGDTLLDVGCGPGALWPHFEACRPGFSYVGVDVTYEMLAGARRLFPQIPTCQADSGRLPFQADSFDIVMMRHVLEHLPPWLMEATIQECIRVARQVVVVNFYLLPVERGSRRTRRDPGNFLETHWTVADIETPVRAMGWRIGARTQIIGSGGGVEEVWTLTPVTAATAEDAKCEQAGSLPMTLPEPAKVSIVMPTYRRSHTIFRTVDTILAQTYRNWELIIVDNAGDADYHFDDPRIRVYRHAAQASASYARNQGLQYVNGDLVCFFDDDDDMFPTYLERFVMAFEAHPQAKMVHCGMIVAQGQINFSYATPECCLRRPFATPTWSNNSFCHDQDYFTEIVRANRWSPQKGEIVLVREALCRANTDPRGGLRTGNL